MSATWTMREALSAALSEGMKRDPRTFLIGEDVRGNGAFGVSRGLVEAFGENRVINAPISEAAFLGLSAGAAMTGQRPVVEIMFSDFLGVGFDMLLNQISKLVPMSGGRLEMPLVVRTTTGAGIRAGGQHSASLYHLLTGIGGLAVVAPSSPSDAYGLFLSCLNYAGPVIFLEHKTLYETSGPIEKQTVPLGKAKVCREGKHLTIAALSSMVSLALEAADELQSRNIDVEVIDLRSIEPLDEEVIMASAGKTGAFLMLDEGPENWGLADRVAALLLKENISCRFASVTSSAGPTPAAALLEDAWRPNLKKVVQKALFLVKGIDHEG